MHFARPITKAKIYARVRRRHSVTIYVLFLSFGLTVWGLCRCEVLRVFVVQYGRSSPFRLHVTDVLEIERAGVVRRWRSVDIGVTARQGNARQATFMT